MGMDVFPPRGARKKNTQIAFVLLIAFVANPLLDQLYSFFSVSEHLMQAGSTVQFLCVLCVCVCVCVCVVWGGGARPSCPPPLYPPLLRVHYCLYSVTVYMGGFRGVSGVSGNPLGVSQVFPQLLFTAKLLWSHVYPMWLSASLPMTAAGLQIQSRPSSPRFQYSRQMQNNQKSKGSSR